VIKLDRVSTEPILLPKPENQWEAAAVFNCAAIADNGFVHLVYRATDVTSNGQEGKYINSLGYAVSEDGIHFNRLENPILVNDVPQELRGPEDPRIVKIGDIFHMMYTGFGGRFDGDYRICHATSRNLIDWTRHGVMLDEPNKDAALLPEKIRGQYIMFHRRPPDIWLCTSEDLKSWSDHRIVMQARSGSEWESEKIGIAGPPIKTKFGWLLIYHGVSAEKRYSLGVALLDLENPAEVVARQTKPILEPELEWEVQGYVPNVVFSCGQVLLGEDIYVYYGGADTCIGVAKMPYEGVKNLLELSKSGQGG
jgi:predicted GH43/DUF377 family glycosyl hydrolase